MAAEFFQRTAVALLVAFCFSCSSAEETPSAPAPVRQAPDPGVVRQAPAPEAERPGLVVDGGAPAQESEGEMAPEETSDLSRVLFEAVDSNDPEDLMDAIAALEDVGGQTAIDTLGVVLQRSQDSDVKIQAIDSLVFLSEEGNVSPHVRRALLDESPEVRAEAADVAGELLLRELLTELRVAEAQEADPGVREVLEDTIYEIESQPPTDEAQ